jgi:hypothetical protein
MKGGGCSDQGRWIPVYRVLTFPLCIDDPSLSFCCVCMVDRVWWLPVHGRGQQGQPRQVTARSCVCIYICVYICVCICIYIYVCVYICINIAQRRTN